MGLFEKFRKPRTPERVNGAAMLFCPEPDPGKVMNMPAPQGLEAGVVMERHRALFWLAGCDDMCGWDDVDLST